VGCRCISRSAVVRDSPPSAVIPAKMADMEEVEVVVAHIERATLATANECRSTFSSIDHAESLAVDSKPHNRLLANQSSRATARRSRVPLMVRWLRSVRSSTPDVCLLNSMTDSGRRSSFHSVTRDPDSIGSMR
jgi:hypothetical protein